MNDKKKIINGITHRHSVKCTPDKINVDTVIPLSNDAYAAFKPFS